MDKEAIREELNKVREQIRDLKKDFSKKKNQKEAHFSRGEEYSTKINSLYDEVKVIESEHDLEKINKELDLKKVEYEELKLKVIECEKNFKEVKSSSNPIKKPEIKTVSVEKAKKDLKKLDLQLQTQVLSLEKESELIKKIEELKELIAKHSGETLESSSEFGDAKKDLNSIKRKFNNVERRIRSLYKQIRLISKDKKKKYKEIDDLRDLKKKSYEEFRSQKKEYGSVGNDLKDLFKREDELLSELGESPSQKKRTFEKNIKIKQKEVESKLMKKGGVLTTEDLLLFQKGK